MIGYEDEEVYVSFRPGTSAYLLITFNNLTTLRSGGGFWGEPVAEKGDLNCLGFVAKRPNWFPAASMAKAIAAVAPVLAPFTQRIAYGSSMGAYGALKYGAALGATRAIGFNPQFSIEPAVVGDFETRFTRHYKPALHDGMAIRPGDCAPLSYLIFDPHREDDARHARLILQQTEVRPIHLFYTGHVSIRAISSAERALSMLRLVLSGRPSEEVRLRRSLLRWRRNSAEFLAYLSDVARKAGRYRLAEGLLLEALGPRTMGMNFSMLEGIARRFLAMGQVEQAGRVIDMAERMGPNDPRLPVVRAKLTQVQSKLQPTSA